MTVQKVHGGCGHVAIFGPRTLIGFGVGVQARPSGHGARRAAAHHAHHQGCWRAAQVRVVWCACQAATVPAPGGHWSSVVAEVLQEALASQGALYAMA